MTVFDPASSLCTEFESFNPQLFKFGKRSRLVVSFLINQRIQVVVERFNIILQLSKCFHNVTCIILKPVISFPENMLWSTLKRLSFIIICLLYTSPSPQDGLLS